MAYIRDLYDVIMIVPDDPDGRFPPDHPLCAPGYRDVPILGAAGALQ